jgi:hypothetical protein
LGVDGRYKRKPCGAFFSREYQGLTRPQEGISSRGAGLLGICLARARRGRPALASQGAPPIRVGAQQTLRNAHQP